MAKSQGGKEGNHSSGFQESVYFGQIFMGGARWSLTVSVTLADMELPCVDKAELEFHMILTAGIKGVYHHTQLGFLLKARRHE